LTSLGSFESRDGKMGMLAVLKERMLHKQGWKITCGDESLICIENGKVEALILTLLCPLRKVQYTLASLCRKLNLASMSMGAGTRVTVTITHCLFGHRNKDSIRKTAKELGWVLKRSMLTMCNHCVKAKKIAKGVSGRESNCTRVLIVVGSIKGNHQVWNLQEHSNQPR
jgi:hypothetical protein